MSFEAIGGCSQMSSGARRIEPAVATLATGIALIVRTSVQIDCG